MSDLQVGYIGLGAIFVLLALRVPIGLALGLVSLVGIVELRGLPVVLAMIRTVPFDIVAHWSLSAIPMFLLMGSIAYHSGISKALFQAARAWLGGLPGGLAVASNFACAGFAAASGVSIATAAAMGRIIIPEMLRIGYDKGLATGVVASAGTLGVLIPPSILMVIYGVFAEVSVSKLFIAGVLPGLLTAAVYAGMIIVRCIITPELAPRYAERPTWAERFSSLWVVWPLVVLITGIIGGLYLGLVTATEAGAVGALLALVIALLQRRMSFETFRRSVIEALITTVQIFFVVIGAVLLARFLTLSGVPAHLAAQIGSWAVDPLLLVVATSVIYLVLGMFLDPIGLMLLTLPLLLPLFETLDLDLIWFGVLVIKFLEIGLITPPVGMNVYVIKSVVGATVPLETIFKGVAWFIVCEILIVVLLVAFPQISLYLPSLMH